MIENNLKLETLWVSRINIQNRSRWKTEWTQNEQNSLWEVGLQDVKEDRKTHETP